MRVYSLLQGESQGLKPIGLGLILSESEFNLILYLRKIMIKSLCLKNIILFF